MRTVKQIQANRDMVREMFLDEHGHDNSDKWGVEYKDGTDRTFKHVYGGAKQLAEMVDWENVKTYVLLMLV